MAQYNSGSANGSDLIHGGSGLFRLVAESQGAWNSWNRQKQDIVTADQATGAGGCTCFTGGSVGYYAPLIPLQCLDWLNLEGFPAVTGS